MHMISLRGVGVHNLKNIDINLPKRKMIVLCGRSGSGKSSLAIDTIFAEGQRRYIETFSPTMRQFLEKFEKPNAEILDGIPPAVTAGHLEIDSHDKTTVGEITEITGYLAQILQKTGHLFCSKCRREIKADTPESIYQTLHGTVLIAFEPPLEASAAVFAEVWKEQGFLRAINRDTVLRLDQPLPPKSYKTGIRIIADRANVSAENHDRIIESLETAMSFGNGVCTVINAETFEPLTYSSRLTCEFCGISSSTPIERHLRADVSSPDLTQLSAMTPDRLRECFEAEPMNDWQRQRIRYELEQVFSRIGYLQQAGLGALPLDALLRELSDGEKRRVTLTAVLASPLVDVLFVLDEPSLGLSVQQTESLLDIIRQLRDRGNTVIVIDHHPVLLMNADHIIELGPGAGADGGQIVFQGTVEEMLQDENSLTGRYLAAGTNGKKRQKIPGLSNGFDEKTVNDSQHYVLTTDILRTSTSNPATYLKFFDEIRNVFAGVPDAKAKNIMARHFSFNVAAGRCEHCKGSGTVTVDMQFLPSQIIRCSECNGKRFQPQVLEILYRSKTITEVLEMTVREAFGFFRGHTKVQKGLKLLLDVGLDYIQIGQSVGTLSGGEVQRLKLAAFLSHLKSGIDTIYIDEPTAGLHFADIDILIECFRKLTQTGRKIIVNTHNEQLLAVC